MLNKEKTTSLSLGRIKFGNLVVDEDVFESKMSSEFDKKVSMLHPRLNFYTNSLVYNVEGMDFRVKITFYNEDIQSIRLSPAENIYENDVIDMNKYHAYIENLKKWATDILGDSYVKVSHRLYWRYSWGSISVPDINDSYSGEMLQIEYGLG